MINLLKTVEDPNFTLKHSREASCWTGVVWEYIIVKSGIQVK
jgi:hypothetical protein